MTPSYVDSFQLKMPDKIVVEQYAKMSDVGNHESPTGTKQITEKPRMAEIIGLVNQLPDEGQVMIKMGDVPVLRATLYYDTAAVYFEFYNKRLKTPATSFYSAESGVEQSLYLLLTK